jgi:hypothetical protein
VDHRNTRCGSLESTIVRVQDLLGVAREGLNSEIRSTFESNEYPAQVYEAMAGGRAEVGDFVLAYGDLAEVLEVLVRNCARAAASPALFALWDEARPRQ